MLHFARRVTFRVNVGNFLELKSTFKRYGVMNAARQIEKIRVAEKLACEVFVNAFSIALEYRFHLVRNAREFLHQQARAIASHTAAPFGHIERDEQKGSELA